MSLFMMSAIPWNRTVQMIMPVILVRAVRTLGEILSVLMNAALVSIVLRIPAALRLVTVCIIAKEQKIVAAVQLARSVWMTIMLPPVSGGNAAPMGTNDARG